MSVAKTQQQSSTFTHHDELILVVKRSLLFSQHQAWNGLKSIDFDSFVTLIAKHREFHPRSLMEQDPTYKQIIPYLVFTHDNRFFLMQRTAKATEQRLQNKFSLGIGGHVREEDLQHNSIFEWARREFHEEVDYNDAISIKPLGILNDDSNPVGQVHIGFVLLVEGASSTIAVKSELKSGQLLTLEECESYRDSMESWSQIVFDYLKNSQ